MKNQNDILPAIESENGKCIPKKIKVFKKNVLPTNQIKSTNQKVHRCIDVRDESLKVNELHIDDAISKASEYC